MTPVQKTPYRKKRYRTVFVLSGALVATGIVWYLSPLGWKFRLHRMDTPSLMVYAATTSGDLEVLLELARRSEQQGLSGEAERLYETAAVADRGKARYWNRAAALAIARTDRNAALEAVQEALKAEPGSAEAHWLSGEILRRDNAWGPAYQAYRAAADRDKTLPGVWAALAQAAYETHRWQEAIDAAALAEAQEPNRVSLPLLRGKAALAAGDLPQAQQALETARKLAPHDPDVLTTWGNLRTRQPASPQNDAEVAHAFQEAARLADRQAAREPLFRWGQWLLERNRPGEAASKLREALMLRPDDAEVLYALSRALQLSGRETEAARLRNTFQKRQTLALRIAQLQKRIGREPKRADLFVRLGEAYYEQGEKAQAVAAWDRSLQLSPQQPALQAKRERVQTELSTAPRK